TVPRTVADPADRSAVHREARGGRARPAVRARPARARALREPSRPLRPLMRRCGLETREELPRLALKVGARRRGDRLTGNELLAERVHESAIVGDAVVELGPRGATGGDVVAGDMFLLLVGCGLLEG